MIRPFPKATKPAHTVHLKILKQNAKMNKYGHSLRIFIYYMCDERCVHVRIRTVYAWCM